MKIFYDRTYTHTYAVLNYGCYRAVTNDLSPGCDDKNVLCSHSDVVASNTVVIEQFKYS